LIKKLSPDMVVLDIIMPNLDGIGVLERITEMQLTSRPLFIMLSAVGQEIFIQKAISLGAEYYMVKPFDAPTLVSRLRQIFKERNFVNYNTSRIFTKASQSIEKPVNRMTDLEVEVTNLIRDVGIPPHLIGYQYIREAIIQSVNSTKGFGLITKVLYPSVAAKFGTSAQKVERAIRNAIESAWARGNPDTVDSLFGYTINYNKGKPTNSEFIAMMSDRIRVSMVKNNN
jgi:two-component system, response regulator, stage 0 sporulation protein A